MPVPSSYNDITEDKSLKDHVGMVWYERKFYVPSSWSKTLLNSRVTLRFENCHYHCIVVSK